MPGADQFASQPSKRRQEDGAEGDDRFDSVQVADKLSTPARTSERHRRGTLEPLPKDQLRESQQKSSSRDLDPKRSKSSQKKFSRTSE